MDVKETFVSGNFWWLCRNTIHLWKQS